MRLFKGLDNRSAVVGITLLGVVAFPGVAFGQVQDLVDVLESAQSGGQISVLSGADRPSSPFVSGLVNEVGPDTCGVGAWTRGTAGVIDTHGANGVNVQYGGALVGADFGCAQIGGSDYSLSGGVIGGLASGRGTQPNNPGNGTLDYNNQFLGAYATFANAPFVADVSVTADHTNVSISGNPVLPGGGAFSIDRVTASAAVSYAFVLSNDFTIVPTAGLSVSHATATALDFPGLGSLQLDPRTSTVGFAGLTLAKTFILPDQVSALQPFVTGTYYHDFSSALTGTFTPLLGPALPLNLGSQDSFGEVSLGANYIRLLEGDTGPSQLNLSLRGDARFNSNMNAYGITGQARVQF